MGVVSPTTSRTLYVEDYVVISNFSYSLPPNSGCSNLAFAVTAQNEAGLGTPNTLLLSQAVERETPGMRPEGWWVRKREERG